MSLQLGQTSLALMRVSEAVTPALMAGGGDGHSYAPKREIGADRLAKREGGAGPDAMIIAGGTVNEQCGMFPYAVGDPLEFDLERLVQRLVAAFRWHPHINNFMTHICGAQWERIEQALRVILRPVATWGNLSPLAQNIVELMWAERGVTGRILKPYFREVLTLNLSQRVAEHLLSHFAGLSSAMKRDAFYPPEGVPERSDQVATTKASG